LRVSAHLHASMAVAQGIPAAHVSLDWNECNASGVLSSRGLSTDFIAARTGMGVSKARFTSLRCFCPLI
jgi:hypothetical protein